MQSKIPDKSPQKIETMFDEISGSYDKLNHIFTLNLDRKWRKLIIKEIQEMNIPADNILDLASGTGDLTMELLKLDTKEIIASDISSRMLEVLKNKINDRRVKIIKADVNVLPFEDDYFDVITIGFGIRNFQDLSIALLEVKRVLKKGGLLIVIEMFKKSGFMIKIFNFYFGKVMPFLGNKLSKSSYAYNYLFESVDNFLTVEKFISLAESRGFRFVKKKNNFIGIVHTIYLKNKGD